MICHGEGALCLKQSPGIGGYFALRARNDIFMIVVKYRPRGSRQVVRRQPSKLIFVGSNPISRSSYVEGRRFNVEC